MLPYYDFSGPPTSAIDAWSPRTNSWPHHAPGRREFRATHHQPRRPASLPHQRGLRRNPRSELGEERDRFASLFEVRQIADVEITLNRQSLGQDQGVLRQLHVVVCDPVPWVTEIAANVASGMEGTPTRRTHQINEKGVINIFGGPGINLRPRRRVRNPVGQADCADWHSM
jgi:hypothetical protein